MYYYKVFYKVGGVKGFKIVQAKSRFTAGEFVFQSLRGNVDIYLIKCLVK